MNFDFLEIIREMLMNLASAIPNILGALLIFFLGWIVARLVAKIIKRVLTSLQVDKYAQKLNDIELLSKSSFKIFPSKILSKIAYYIIILVFAIAATETLGMPAVSNLVTDLINYIPQLITALMVLGIGLVVADFIKNILLTTMKSLGIPTASMIANVIFWFLFLTVIMSALSQAGINTEFIKDNMKIIVGGAVAAFALGYGLASKDMMGNLLASVTTKKKLSIGQNINIGNYGGEIIDMDNNSITLSSNGKKVVIPLNRVNTEIIEFN